MGLGIPGFLPIATETTQTLPDCIRAARTVDIITNLVRLRLQCAMEAKLPNSIADCYQLKGVHRLTKISSHLRFCLQEFQR